MNLSAQSSSRFNGCLTASLRAHRRGVSPQYVNRRVVVGMGFEATMSATEDRLALATSAVNGSAFRTGLACVSGRDFNQRPAAFFKFVCKDGLERVPALIENRSVKTSLRADTATWGFNRSGRTRGHIGDLQVLHDNRSEPARDVQRGTVMPVPADTSALGRQAGASAELLQSSLGAFLATRKDALSAPVLTIYGRKAHRDGQMLAGRERQRVGDAAVNADAREVINWCDVVDLAGEADMPAKLIERDCGASNLTLCGVGTSEFEPTDFRHPYGRPLRAELACRCVTTLKSKAIVQSLFSRRRVLSSAVKECGVRTIKVSQGLNKAVIRHRRNPIELLSKLGYFETLSRIIQTLSSCASVLPPKIATLFEREIVNESRDAGELREQMFLLWRRIQFVAESAVHMRILSFPHGRATAALAQSEEKKL